MSDHVIMQAINALFVASVKPEWAFAHQHWLDMLEAQRPVYSDGRRKGQRRLRGKFKRKARPRP